MATQQASKALRQMADDRFAGHTLIMIRIVEKQESAAATVSHISTHTALL